MKPRLHLFILTIIACSWAMTCAHAETPEQQIARVKNALRGVFLERGWQLLDENQSQLHFSRPLGPTAAFVAGVNGNRDGLQRMDVTFQRREDGLVMPYTFANPPILKNDVPAIKAIFEEAKRRAEAAKLAAGRAKH